MTEQRGLSRRQFATSSFDPDGYVFNEQPGEFVAVIDCKRWGKRKKLITYMTFEDGRRVVAPTWPRSRHEGLADTMVGSRIRIGYRPNNAGTLCVRSVNLLEDPR